MSSSLKRLRISSRKCCERAPSMIIGFWQWHFQHVPELHWPSLLRGAGLQMKLKARSSWCVVARLMSPFVSAADCLFSAAPLPQTSDACLSLARCCPWKTAQTLESHAWLLCSIRAFWCHTTPPTRASLQCAVPVSPCGLPFVEKDLSKLSHLTPLQHPL